MSIIVTRRKKNQAVTSQSNQEQLKSQYKQKQKAEIAYSDNEPNFTYNATSKAESLSSIVETMNQQFQRSEQNGSRPLKQMLVEYQNINQQTSPKTSVGVSSLMNSELNGPQIHIKSEISSGQKNVQGTIQYQSNKFALNQKISPIDRKIQSKSAKRGGGRVKQQQVLYMQHMLNQNAQITKMSRLIFNPQQQIVQGTSISIMKQRKFVKIPSKNQTQNEQEQINNSRTQQKQFSSSGNNSLRENGSINSQKQPKKFINNYGIEQQYQSVISNNTNKHQAINDFLQDNYCSQKSLSEAQNDNREDQNIYSSKKQLEKLEPLSRFKGDQNNL
ncbi:UNKNOWN [Stylonychia lemnae]|uniref:Uncharacterized protein n=1 Tax=Stylonychia lemnae TaxID=5949 RepID=A0A078A6G0_STYLE|nr:UNKNOWN [Stylonychia lemnae]|eukprot:CDW77850.1 UNKNOWN [Stylonychia lemnae]